MTSFLIDGSPDAATTILLAPGASGTMNSPSLNAIVAAFVERGFRVARFEFDYMAQRRITGSNKPPPRGDLLKPEYIAAVEALGARGPLIIGGKSLGGRVASMVADQLFTSGQIAGLLCLGYPFHPIGKPDQLRTAHLAELRTPALIVQGTRDQFGTREEVSTYTISTSIEVIWLEDGDHDLKPRKALTGLTTKDHLRTMADRVAAWSTGLPLVHG